MFCRITMFFAGVGAERYSRVIGRGSRDLVATIFLLLTLGCYNGESSVESLKGIQQRITDERYAAVIKGVRWALIHCSEEADEKAQNVLSIFEAIERGDFSQVQGTKGLSRFRDQVEDLLRSRDGIVRGFGALVLAVMGEHGSVESIAGLLRGEPAGGAADQPFVGWDRHVAAMALGILEARKYTERLVELLRTQNTWVRQGAAVGLGFMKAHDQAEEVATLLDDPRDEVKMAAINGLVLMNAEDQSGKIARLIVRGAEDDVLRMACLSLAKLNAKTCAESIVSLVRKGAGNGVSGDAAEALGMMGSKEYAQDIARLLGDSENSVCIKALKALQALGAKEYAREILACLKREECVRSEAAKVLGELGDETIVQGLAKTREVADDKRVQIWASYAVMKIEKNHSGVEFLINALKDEDLLVRDCAREALKAITGLEYDADYEKWQVWWKAQARRLHDK